MVNLESLRQRYELINELYAEHLRQVEGVQEQARHELVSELAGELQLEQSGVDRAAAFLEDPLTIYRFCRKAHFDDKHALELLRRTLRWRLASSLDLVSPGSLDPLYSERPLFYLHPHLRDRFGRHSAVVNLRHIVRPEDGSLDSFKEFIAFQLEVARRFLADLTRRDGGKPHVQIVLILNLSGASLSNFEVEMLPFIVDLLKNHFPAMIGAVYILNYGWAYAGMWQVAKRVLPKVALERILFPSNPELFTYFEKDHVLAEHGGNVNYKYRMSNNHVLLKYGRPSYFLRYRSSGTPSHSTAASPVHSRPISRTASFESMQEIYYSMPSTPKSSTSRSPAPSFSALPTIKQGITPLTPVAPGAVLGNSSNHKAPPKWLDMTTLKSNQFLYRIDKSITSPVSSSPLRTPLELPLSRVASVRDFREAMSDPALQQRDQDYFQYETGSEASEGEPAVTEDEDEDGNCETRSSTLRESRDSRTRANSIAALRKQLGQNEMRTLRRSGKLSGTVSPYNATNPFYGYPATRYVPTGPSGTVNLPQVRPYHGRRRKRDLVRTLSYLATLRVLALHRKLKLRFTFFWRYLWDLLWRWGAISSAFRKKNLEETGSSRTAYDEIDEDDAEDESFMSNPPLTPLAIGGGGGSGSGVGNGKKRGKRKGVHWAADSDLTRKTHPLLALLKKIILFSPEKVFRTIPRWIIWISALVFLRSNYFRQRARTFVLLVKEELTARWAALQARRKNAMGT